MIGGVAMIGLDLLALQAATMDLRRALVAAGSSPAMASLDP